MSEKKTGVTVITFGTYDLLHIGHINLLKRAKNLGDRLIVGVSSNVLQMSKKGKHSVYSHDDRLDIISSIKYVDEVFLEESLEKKREYILQHKADILVMGSDWSGKFDFLKDICKVIYLDRTENISTTETVENITETQLEKIFQKTTFIMSDILNRNTHGKPTIRKYTNNKDEECSIITFSQKLAEECIEIARTENLYVR